MFDIEQKSKFSHPKIIGSSFLEKWICRDEVLDFLALVFKIGILNLQLMSLIFSFLLKVLKYFVPLPETFIFIPQSF